MDLNDFVGTLAERHGLVRVPLFGREGDRESSRHELLLDGPFGSFAISRDAEVDVHDAVSWAWSSNVPHHVTLGEDRIRAIRWDRPKDGQVHRFAAVLDGSGDFYSGLRKDRVDPSLGIVAKNLALFRGVRVAAHQRREGDDEAVAAYLAVLDAMARADRVMGGGLADGTATELMDREVADRVLGIDTTRQLLSEFATADMHGMAYRTWSSLSLRHAAGTIFQEAHNDLTTVPPTDLFGYVRPQAGRKSRRTAVYFTPPTLARSLAEQALASLDDLHGRDEIVVADYACGSGAFLIECIRALARQGYAGRLRLVGRDVSPLAIQMARFALTTGLADQVDRGDASLDVQVGNSLTDELPPADLIVMNPPFVTWNTMSVADRERVAQTVPGSRRPDMSLAFVTRGLDGLRDRGAMAAIVPEVALGSRAHRRWREEVASRTRVRLAATFDDLAIFEGATVRIGAMVCARGEGEVGTSYLRSGSTQEALPDALRALRRMGASGRDHLSGEDWSILIGEGSDRFEDGTRFVPGESAPLSRPTGSTQAHLPGLTTLSSLFDVVQGVRTGRNEAFELDDEALSDLPADERSFFRKAVTNAGLVDGRVLSHVNVFYPFLGERQLIVTEEDLIRDVPQYHERHLKRWKTSLVEARGADRNWWIPERRRARLDRERPLLVSKYFVGPLGFALDEVGTGMVLQGHALVPKGAIAEPMRRSDTLHVPRLARAYLAILNSARFYGLIGRAAQTTKGGQHDISKRYVWSLPLPDLTAPNLVGYLTPLADYADEVYRGLDVEGRVPPDRKGLEKLVEDLLSPATYLIPSPEERRRFVMPAWMSASLDVRGDDPADEVRYQLLRRIQALAGEGGVEELDAVLFHLDEANVATLVMVTLVRGTYPFQGSLKSWVSFRDRVAGQFERRGLTVDKAMFGLYR